MRVLLLSLFFSSVISYSQSDKFFNFYLDNLEGLNKVYNKDFIIGSAVSYKDINNPKLSKLIKKHYSSITAENEMKPEALLNDDGSFSWGKADAIMDFAKTNNLMVRGHTLIWHKQTPECQDSGRSGRGHEHPAGLGAGRTSQHRPQDCGKRALSPRRAL